MSAGTGNDDKAATEDPVLRCCRKVSDSRSLADVTAALPALKQMHQACALGVCARRVRPACAPGVCARRVRRACARVCALVCESACVCAGRRR
jgi:hypothetical protein